MPVYSRKTGTLEVPRLPRLGIIRLGYKESRTNKAGKEYSFPRAAEHFVLVDAPEVAKVFGDTPTVLEPIVIPTDDEEVVASHWLRHYTMKWGLTCIGNARAANRRADKAVLDQTGEAKHASHATKETVWTPVTCPCPLLESGDCRETMYLRFVLPSLPGLGVWQISTGSSNSIKNIQGTFAMLRSMTGRVSGHLLKLSLVEQEVFTQQGGRQTVRVLRLDPYGQASMADMLRNARALGPKPIMSLIEPSPPEEEGPPEDIGESGEEVPSEAEEAEYLSKSALDAAEADEFQRFMDEERPTQPASGGPSPSGNLDLPLTRPPGNRDMFGGRPGRTEH